MALNPKNWTLKTQEAVAAAVDQAKALSNPELTPDHLLAAIVRQDDTIVPAVLAKLGQAPLMVRNSADEKVAKLHLAKIGVELETLSSDQANYIGVSVEGPFKPEHYRY